MTDLDGEFAAEEYRRVAEQAALSERFAAGEIDVEIDRGAVPVELPSAAEGDHLMVRSLRLPLSLELRVQALAKARGVLPTRLMRELIARGVEEAEQAVDDPVAELRHISEAATRALRALEAGRRPAA